MGGGGMIRAMRVFKDYRTEGRVHRVLNEISFTMPKGEKLAILGRNGAGKSTLIRLLGRVELPTSGMIERTMSLSWPIGLTGGFQGSLTGNDNMRFIARIYNKPFEDIKAYVEDFAELGKYLSEPVKIYSIGMRARFAFALSLAIDFDCYLIDEVIAAGDQRFQRRSYEELFEKRADRSLILASHSGEIIRAYCSSALILHRGRGKVFSDLDTALQIYNDL
jgi:capsular polysaccharide transport system ATP-binding protein